MALDGISFEGVSVRVKRPTDYNPALAAVLGPSLPSPHLNLAAVGLVPGAVAGAEGPDRIFVGGIPYYFSEEQMRELLESFGPLKGFDLVKDRDTGNSKGYGFCVYQVTSTVVMKGSIYEVQMHVENTSKKPNPKDLLHRNHFCPRIADGDNNGALLQLMPEGTQNKQQAGILHRIYGHFSHGSDGLRVAEIEGSDVGVAFFFHFSVHKSKTELKEGEDTRILPVHYSDNYFSLVPGEIMSVSMTFEVPPGEAPLIKLNGWNYNVGLTVK